MNKNINRIITDPKIMMGNPIIKGTRITVSHILEQLSQGMKINELLDEYPNISYEDILACFAFAKDTKNCLFFN